MTGNEPWTADRPLDAEGARRAVEAAVPELAPAETRLLGSGWDFDAYEVNARWVFRFPRRTAEQDRLRKDLALLGWLGNALDAPMPRYRWGLLSADAFPYVFSGYEKLLGTQAIEFDAPALDARAIGGWLGRFYRSLHALRPSAALVAKAGLSQRRVTPREHKEQLGKYLSGFLAHAADDLGGRAERFFEDGLSIPAPYEGPLRLVHDDLHAEHLLLDPTDPARVTGLLDWSDVALSDPAHDFATIFPWGGEPLLEAMLQGYGDADPDLAARARYDGLWLALQDWSYWRRIGKTVWSARVERVLDDALPH